MIRYKVRVYDIVDFAIWRSGLTKAINGCRVKLPARWYRSFPHDYEAGNFVFMRKHLTEGNVALDVGAHVGLYSVVMAQIVGPSGEVHAFEPSPVTRSELERLVRMNDVAEHVILNALAVSESSGWADFFVDRADSSVSDSLVNRGWKSKCRIRVELTSIDEYVFRRALKDVHFIKIDAEGSELDVLKGAEGVLMRNRPFLLLEIHPKAFAFRSDGLDDIWIFLDRTGYDVVVQDKHMTKSQFCQMTELCHVQLLPRS